jgi:hypothetical protein
MSIPLNKPVICPILIGRPSELTTLHTLIARAGSAPGLIVLISGEAGIGKSRLVAEAQTYGKEQHFLLLQGNCFPTDRTYPYAPGLRRQKNCSPHTPPTWRHAHATWHIST